MLQLLQYGTAVPQSWYHIVIVWPNLDATMWLRHYDTAHRLELASLYRTVIITYLLIAR